MSLLLSYFQVICGHLNVLFFLFLAVPEPLAFYPLNSRYKAAEKENRQPKGILGDVAITNGPYNEPGRTYMFYGTRSSYIYFPNRGGLDTRFSITLMCWVQLRGRDGPLFYYERGVQMWIVDGKFYNQIVKRRNSQPLTSIRTAEVLPAGKWVHVAASYDHNTGNNSLYINGHFSVSQNIGKGYEIATTTDVVMGVTFTISETPFKGKIAEMKVYDVALNEAQIQTSIRQGNCTFPEIIVSSPSPTIPLETPVIAQPRKSKTTLR